MGVSNLTKGLGRIPAYRIGRSSLVSRSRGRRRWGDWGPLEFAVQRIIPGEAVVFGDCLLGSSWVGGLVGIFRQRV